MNASKEDEQAIDAYLNAQYESLQHGLRQWEAQMLGMDDVTFADYASKVVEAGNVVHINCMRRVQDMRKLASLTPIQHDGRGEA